MKTDCTYFAIDAIIKKKFCKTPYTYKINPELINKISKGTILTVPVGKTITHAVCVTKPYKIDDDKKLKEIIAINHSIKFNQPLLKTLSWMANYFAHNIGESLSLALPAFEIKPLFEKKISLNKNYNFDKSSLSNSRKNLISSLNSKHTKNEIINNYKISGNLLSKMIKDGQLIQTCETISYNFPNHKYYAQTKLNPHQQNALNQLYDYYKNGWSMNLLDGVTGSGKTEVYFKLIEKVIFDKKQILVLVPEIGLCEQICQRFEKHFSIKPLIWHSNITAGEKNKVMNYCASEKPLVVIGTRSSLFLPFKNIGAIIIDEEHDQSYKQEEGIIYNARDTAIVRAKNENCICVLSTATPSIETWKNIRQNKTNHIILPSKFSKNANIEFNVVDITINRPDKGKYISEKFINLIKNTINNQEQALIFMNKKGYSSLLICNSCGHKIDCKNCDSYMSYYKSKNILQCKFCDHTIEKPLNCPTCDGENTLVPFGPGIEKIEEEIAEYFPDKNIFIATSETLHNQDTIKKFLEKMEKGTIDIIIATQIISKGYHFSNLTFVGIVDADWGMFGGNIKNAENTYQLLNQVTGRSGRNKQGTACLQTSNPDNRVIKALISNERDIFLNSELEMRKKLMLPPYTKFISIVCSHHSKNNLDNFIINLYNNRPTIEQTQFYPPIETEIPFLRNQHRMKILIKIAPKIYIISKIKQWVETSKAGDIKIKIDVDPYNFN